MVDGFRFLGLVGGDRLVTAAGPTSRRAAIGREWALSPDGWVRDPHAVLALFNTGFVYAREAEAARGSAVEAEPS